MSDATLESEKAKIEECLCVDLLSSEDSDEDGSFIIHPLPWRSRKVDNILRSLDRKVDRKKSKRSKLMTFHRNEGSISSRPKPPKGYFSEWILKK